MSSKFVNLYGKHFFLGNSIQHIKPVKLSTLLLQNGLKLFPKSSTSSSTSFLKSSLFPIFSKSKPSTLITQSKTPTSIQIKNFTTSGTLKYIKISNYNYGRNYSVLKQASIFSLIFIGVTTISIPYLFQYTPLKYFQKHPNQLIYGIIGLNLAVFLLWQIPRNYKLLSRYALLEKDVLYSKWSIIGSAFSHQELWHLGMNMLALYSFGTSLSMMIGSSNFLTLYLNSAVLSSLVSIAYPILFKLPLTAPSLGASGALFAVFGTFACLVPNAKILLFIFPIPGGAMVAFLGATVWNVAGCVMRWGSFDYAAHLGGSIAGLGYGWYISEKVRKERERRMRSFRF